MPSLNINIIYTLQSKMDNSNQFSMQNYIKIDDLLTEYDSFSKICRQNCQFLCKNGHHFEFQWLPSWIINTICTVYYQMDILNQFCMQDYIKLHDLVIGYDSFT